MSRPLILGLILLLFIATGLGLLLGLRVAGLDESAVIERAARAYVAGGGRLEDCVARPGSGPVWIVVTCGRGEGAFVRAFDRRGFVVDTAPVPGI
ncbi:MAG: hypothetical protein QNJ13_14300 [Paracoccaceae bacterium]|nr:hypothetical protein [Paracoccaceae bacterium]